MRSDHARLRSGPQEPSLASQGHPLSAQFRAYGYSLSQFSPNNQPRPQVQPPRQYLAFLPQISKATRSSLIDQSPPSKSSHLHIKRGQSPPKFLVSPIKPQFLLAPTSYVQ